MQKRVAFITKGTHERETLSDSQDFWVFLFSPRRRTSVLAPASCLSILVFLLFSLGSIHTRVHTSHHPMHHTHAAAACPAAPSAAKTASPTPSGAATVFQMEAGTSHYGSMHSFPSAAALVTSHTVRSSFQIDTVRSSSLTNLTPVALCVDGDLADAGVSMSAATPWCA